METEKSEENLHNPMKNSNKNKKVSDILQQLPLYSLLSPYEQKHLTLPTKSFLHTYSIFPLLHVYIYIFFPSLFNYYFSSCHILLKTLRQLTMAFQCPEVNSRCTLDQIITIMDQIEDFQSQQERSQEVFDSARGN